MLAFSISLAVGERLPVLPVPRNWRSHGCGRGGVGTVADRGFGALSNCPSERKFGREKVESEIRLRCGH